MDRKQGEAKDNLFSGLRGRICRWPEVQRITGMSRPGLHKAMKRGEFPRPINISRQSVGWIGDELALFSHAFTKAVEWGLIDRHPTIGQVRLQGEQARDRYVEDWEIIETLALPARRKKGSVRMIQAYIRLKLLTGLRRGDLLRLQMRDIKENGDGIYVKPGKTAKSTGKRLIYEWTPALREAVAMAREARPVDIGPYLFCDKYGECYIKEKNGRADGWDSMWQRFMARVLAETKVENRFTEHDLRAKAGSDAESLERARQLLAHADARLTQRVYRRKPERVKPLK